MAVTAFKSVGNNIGGTLDGAILAADPTLDVQTGEGAAFPAVPFWATLWEGTDPGDMEVNEIVLVTGIAGDTLTITRAQQGTAANSWADNANIQVCMTASNLTETQTAINNLETRLGTGTTDVTIDTGDIDQTRSGAVLNNTFTSYNGGADNMPWDLRISRGTSGTPAVVQDLDKIELKFWGHDGAAFRQFAALRAYINGTPGASDMPGALGFYVTPDASATPALALTIAQDKSAAFAGAITGASTLNMTGAVTMQSTAAVYSDLTLGNAGTANRRLNIKANAGYRADVYLGGELTALRWAFQKDATAESGANAGSDFRLSAYSDTGVFIDSPFICSRVSGGAFTFYRPVTLNGTSALTVGGNLTVNGNSVLGNASTDTITVTGRLLCRQVTDAGPMTATGGTQGEIVFNTSNSKSYTCTVTHATAATWQAHF